MEVTRNISIYSSLNTVNEQLNKVVFCQNVLYLYVWLFDCKSVPEIYCLYEVIRILNKPCAERFSIALVCFTVIDSCSPQNEWGSCVYLRSAKSILVDTRLKHSHPCLKTVSQLNSTSHFVLWLFETWIVAVIQE